MMVRVMVIAAHDEVRASLCTMLRLSGCLEVVVESSGLAHASGQVALEIPDVALVDLDMPNGRGLDNLRHICALLPEVKVIAITTYETLRLIEAARSAGAHRVLIKGIDWQELVSVIFELVSVEPHS